MTFLTKLLNNSFIKVWVAVIFIIILLQFWGEKSQLDPVVNIIESEKNRVRNFVDRVNYHSEFLIDYSQINSTIRDMIDNSQFEIDLILPSFDLALLDRIKMANSRGVRVRIITKSIYKNIIDDLTKLGITVNYNNYLDNGIIYIDKSIGANLISFNNSFLLTIFQDNDSIQRYQILIDEQFLKSRKIF
ncbi:hypothetical protein J3U56_02120 [Gilliamella sp. B2824]|uniref:hypothetical protein n=1 Tax=Gilliamella sp. B2824 TaxID=2818019 RepID=UPI00226ADCA9|nr:hypothetical protein [Gilliamella sp. B2824]MCX8738119.1 hypothetical protein [Gilliamella sp. B2824]